MSFRYWQDRLDGAPSAVGSTVDLNGVSVAIVGVAPPEFHGETLQADPPSFWLPISADRHLNPERTVIDEPGSHWLYLMGRLKPAVSAAQGEARLTAALQNWLLTREGSTISAERRRRIAEQSRRAHAWRQRYPPHAAELFTDVATSAGHLGRGSADRLCEHRQPPARAGRGRRAETSIRLALGRQPGASRAPIAHRKPDVGAHRRRAGSPGRFGGHEAARRSRLPRDGLRPIQAAPDFLVLAFTFALSCAAAVVFGLLPAMRMTSGAAPAIGGTSRGILGSVSRRKFGLSNLLIVGEVALSLVVLAGAGLFVRSLLNLTDQPFGFDRENVLVVSVDPGLARYEYTRLGPLYQQMDARLNSLPGVKSAAFSYYSPFNGCCWAYSVSVQGYTPQPQENMQARLNRVSPRYFETLGTRVLLGRAFDEHDTPMASRVAVVNEAFVHRYLPDGNPIGRRFGIDSDDGTSARSRDRRRGREREIRQSP